MALSTKKSNAVWQTFVSVAQRTRDGTQGDNGIPWPKPLLKQIVADIEAWDTANATSFNQALSQPFRGSATANEKRAFRCLVDMALMDNEDRNALLGALRDMHDVA